MSELSRPRADHSEQGALRWLGPAQAFDGGELLAVRPSGLEYSVPTSPQLCPGCMKPVITYKGKGDPSVRCVGIHPDGEVAWWHLGCRIDARGETAGAMWRKKGKTVTEDAA